MKYKTKDIKKLGRAYGKRKFKLIDVDAQDKVVLDMIEEAYLAGFKNAMLSVTRIYDRQGFGKSIICNNVF